MADDGNSGISHTSGECSDPDVGRVHASGKRKRSRSPSKRRRSFSRERSRPKAHPLSDSEPDKEFLGYAPVYEAHPSGKSHKAPVKRQLSSKASVPPQGPWQQFPLAPWPMPMPPQSMTMMPQYYDYGYNNYWAPGAPAEASDEENVSLLSDSDDDSQRPEGAINDQPSAPGPPAISCIPRAMPADKPSTSGVSLSAHMQAVSTDNDVGPPVGEDLAQLTELIWGKTHKEEMKSLYTDYKRAPNTPSLQKVQLDEDICRALKDKSRARRSDAVYGSISNALAKTAVCLTSLVEVNQQEADQPGISQKSADHAVNGLRMLSYANHLLHQVRRDHIKSVLPALRQNLGKDKDLSEVNESHQLFGGDMQKQVKEGEFTIQCSPFLIVLAFASGFNSPVSPFSQKV